MPSAQYPPCPAWCDRLGQPHPPEQDGTVSHHSDAGAAELSDPNGPQLLFLRLTRQDLPGQAGDLRVQVYDERRVLTLTLEESREIGGMLQTAGWAGAQLLSRMG